MGFLLQFDSEFGGLRFWLIWLLGFDEDDDEKEVFYWVYFCLLQFFFLLLFVLDFCFAVFL